jgi:glycosyltransferase involved in cell wall biosynthesis
LLRIVFTLLIHRRAFVSKKGKTNLQGKLPPLSVIIAAKNEQTNLKQFLPLIFNQDYPEFEVIVVDDCSIDDSREKLALFQKEYKNLKISWTPKNAISSGGKKLALSLGIKAAQHEQLIFIDADCYPETDQWLRNIAINFTESTDFVLGYGGYKHHKGLLNSLIRYDTLKIAMNYGGFAKAGKVYMGVGRNLAYRKSIWEENRGFAKFTSIASGDDDLFVNAYAKSKRTSLCFSKESKTVSIPPTSFSEWVSQKSRHIKTSAWYSKWLRFLLIIEPINHVISPILIVFFMTYFYKIQISYIIPGIWIVTRIIELFVLKKASKTLGETKLLALSPIFDVLLPLIYIIFAFSGLKTSKEKVWK